MNSPLPPATVRRLPRYLHFLETAETLTVSSEEIAAGSGVNAAQVRKDLSYLGSFGTRGVGYQSQMLAHLIRGSLGLSKQLKVAIVGGGNLGTALAGYGGFDNRGFSVVAIYDILEDRIGKHVGDLKVRSLADFETDAKELGIDIVAIVTPADAAQAVADRAAKAGIRALLNFAPITVRVTEDVAVRQVDLATEFQILSYHLANRG